MFKDTFMFENEDISRKKKRTIHAMETLKSLSMLVYQAGNVVR